MGDVNSTFSAEMSNGLTRLSFCTEMNIFHQFDWSGESEYEYMLCESFNKPKKVSLPRFKASYLIYSMQTSMKIA